MKRWIAGLCLLALGSIVLTGALLAWGWRVIHTPHGPATTTEIDVLPGSSATRILTDLENRGLLADARLASLYLVHVLDDPPLHSGEYRIETPATTPQILGRADSG